MYITKNQLKILLGGTCLILSLLVFNNQLQAQNNFIMGIFGYDAPFPGRPLDAHEQGLILGTNSNFIAGCISPERQDEFITFGNANNYQMMLEHDPTSDPVTGPFYPYPGTPENIALWPYICRNTVAQIDCVLIEQFIDNVYATYPNDPGLSDILIGHQGETDDPGHWPFIQYASALIQENFGDNVRSVVIDVAHTYSGSTLENFFSTVDTLDVFQGELYPFYESNQPYPPTDSADFVGYEFQTTIIDNRIINDYNHAWQSLTNSSNNHTKLEMIIQTQREWFSDYYGTRFLRRPTEAEIWLQAFLALSRNFKGIHAYVYFSQQSYRMWGLVNEASPRQVVNPWYGYVNELYDNLSILGPELLNHDVIEAFTWTGTPHSYITDIEGDTADGGHGTIEVAIFDQIANGQTLDYFMLINRRCNRDSAGVWVDAYPQHITLTIDPDVAGSYQIRDLYSEEIFVANDSTFENIEILAGRGRLFELIQVFPNDISGTVSYYYDAYQVSNTILDLTHEEGTSKDTTDADGDFLFESVIPGDVNLVPSKEGDQRDAITGSDALLLLQYLAFLATLTEDQQFAADVTENGSVTGSDAQAILAYLAFLPNHASTGEWRFDPSDTSFLLIENAIIDFRAFLLGDVTGNWDSETKSGSDSLGALAEVKLNIDVPIANKEGYIEVPITVTKVKTPLYTFILSITYNPKYLQYQETKTTELSEKYMLVANGTDSGIVHIAMAGINGIEKDGEVVRLLFKGDSATISEKDIALKITRAIINDYEIIKGDSGQICLPKQLVKDHVTSLPDHFSLDQNYPNPFNPETEIRYQLPELAHVTLTIYNLLGLKIRTLIDKQQQAGYHSVHWDGRDEIGTAVASGVYFYVLHAGQFEAVKKMILLH